MSSHFHKYFKQREKNVFQSLNDFDASSHKNSMHHLRVELKKLKALIRFLHETNNKQKLKKASKKLKRLFKAAGEIREYQLVLQWLRENDFTSIEKEFYPEENLNKLCNYFHSCIHEYKNDLDKVIKTCDEYVNDIQEKTEEKYIDDLSSMIEKRHSENLPTSEWHELRKIVKRWIYALDGLNKDDAKKYEENAAHYDKLQQAIGDWHDLDVMKNSFIQKHIFLSSGTEVQKEFNLAWEKLTKSHKQKESEIEKLLKKDVFHNQ